MLEVCWLLWLPEPDEGWIPVPVAAAVAAAVAVAVTHEVKALAVAVPVARMPGLVYESKIIPAVDMSLRKLVNEVIDQGISTY